MKRYLPLHKMHQPLRPVDVTKFLMSLQRKYALEWCNTFDEDPYTMLFCKKSNSNKKMLLRSYVKGGYFYLKIKKFYQIG